MSRVQPRRLAPVLLAGGNVAAGVAGLVSNDTRVPSYAHLTAVMPFTCWWLSFLALGALILTGPVSLTLARVTAVVAVGWWTFYACLIAETVSSPLVSDRAVVQPLWLAVLHSLLLPYFRDLGRGPDPPTR